MKDANEKRINVCGIILNYEIQSLLNNCAVM